MKAYNSETNPLVLSLLNLNSAFPLFKSLLLFGVLLFRPSTDQSLRRLGCRPALHHIFYYLMTDDGVFECSVEAYHSNAQNAFDYFRFGGFDNSVINNFGCGGDYGIFHVFQEMLGLG